MKFRWFILFLVVVMAACTPSAETRHGASLSDDAIQETHHGTSLPNDGVRETQNLASLQAIDSLMWRRPDSALMVMQGFAGSPEADSLDVFEGHYCQVLISELLYKNDCGQSNRAELLQAVGYFDSIVGTDGADARGASPQRGASLQRGATLRERDAFLDARAHYINGAGLYEQGDVVEACAEYLKALEVMEERFEEKEMVGQLAQFMSYTYNRLAGLFSSQFMMEPAILCYKEAQVYCMVEQTSPYGISNNYYRIGIQYNKLGLRDSAMYYYEKAIGCLTDSNSLVYRNIETNKSLLYYQMSKDAELSIQNLKSIAGKSANESERLTRYLTIGDVYYEAGNYDSALFYLERVFENKEDEISQIQAAACLRNVYDSIGEFDKADVCTRFLADHRKPEGKTNALTSQLENMFKTYQNQKQEKESEKEREKSIRKTIGIIVPIALAIALAIIVMAKRRSRKLLLQQQEDADRVLGETKQAHEEELRRLQAETKQRLEEAERKHRQKVAEMAKRRKEHEAETQTLNEEKQQLQTRVDDALQQLQTVDDALQQLQTQADDVLQQARAMLPQRVADLYRAKVPNRLERIMDEFEAAYPGAMERVAAAYPNLTKTETQLFVLSFLQFRAKEEADLLGLSQNTVLQYRSNLRKKTGNASISSFLEM